MKLTKMQKEIHAYLKKNLSKERCEHSMRVADCALDIARKYGKTKKIQRLVYFAGLSHDLTKELSDAKQLSIAKKAHVKLTAIEKQRINLIHGFTAAYELKKKFGVTHKEVLHAIAYHTFGSKDFRSIGKILFVADKIEPGRENSKHFRAMVGKVSLNKLTLEVLKESMSYVKAKGLCVSPYSRAMKKSLTKGK